MIYYFSATGNCEYVANEIAKALNTKAVSIETLLKNENKVINEEKEEYIGFVTPTYRFVIPTILEEFLNEFTIINDKAYCFAISTYGTTCGVASNQIKHILEYKGKDVKGLYSVKMPDNWTPMNDMNDHKKIESLIESSSLEIKDIICKIKNKETSNKPKGSLPYFILGLGKLWYNKTRETKSYYSLDNCIGCKKCENNCPVQAIKVENNKVLWVKDKCVMCARCLHNCPEFSIQIKNSKSLKHGQYLHKMYEK